MTPYNTGKVLIGLLYQRPAHIDSDPDMQRLQSALIGRSQRLVENQRSEILNAITEVVLWTLSAAIFVAIPYTPMIWRLLAGE